MTTLKDIGTGSLFALSVFLLGVFVVGVNGIVSPPPPPPAPSPSAPTSLSPLADANNRIAGWSFDAQTGCAVWNPAPEPDETVRWSGACQDGVATGPGIVQWFVGMQVGNRLESTYINGRDRIGSVTITYPDGSKYIGSLNSNGNREGPGTLLYASGRKYVGDWKDGKKDGQGTMYLADGAIDQSGIWVNGAFVRPTEPPSEPAPGIPSQVIELKVGTAQPFTLSTPFASVLISDPTVAEVIPQTYQSVLLIPKKVGQTSIVFTNQSGTILENVIAHVTSPGNSVPIYVKERSVWVDVQLGSLTRRMLIDTGATDVTVTKSVANDLLRRGDAVLGDPGEFRDFEGWKHIEDCIQILTLNIGGHTLHNIFAGVVPDEGEMLLGFPVLNQVGRFTIDTKNRQLIFD